MQASPCGPIKMNIPQEMQQMYTDNSMVFHQLFST